jgi:hypothetical protein
MPRQLFVTPQVSKDTFSPKLVDKSYLDNLETTLNDRLNHHLLETFTYREKMGLTPRIIIDEKEFKNNPLPYYFALETMVENCPEGEIIFDVKAEHPFTSVYASREKAIEYLSMRKEMIMFEASPYDYMLKINADYKRSLQNLRFDN